MATLDTALEQVRTRNYARDDRAMRVGGVESGFDYVVLADGSLFVVQRNNLAAAKALLAAQKATLRRLTS